MRTLAAAPTRCTPQLPFLPPGRCAAAGCQCRARDYGAPLAAAELCIQRGTLPGRGACVPTCGPKCTRHHRHRRQHRRRPGRGHGRGRGCRTAERARGATSGGRGGCQGQLLPAGRGGGGRRGAARAPCTRRCGRAGALHTGGGRGRRRIHAASTAVPPAPADLDSKYHKGLRLPDCQEHALSWSLPKRAYPLAPRRPPA